MVENELINGVITIISTVGFPIAMCLLSFWQSNNVIKENTKAIQDLKESMIAIVSSEK